MKNENYNTADDIAKQKAALFQDHLSKIHCAYSHLAERFSELTGGALFEDLSGVIATLIKRSENQLEQLDLVYRLLKQKPDFIREEKLIHFLEDNFSRIQFLPTYTTKALCRAHLLSYLYYTDSILIASFQLLQLTEETSFNDEVRQLIRDLFLLAQKENTLLSVLK